MAAPAGLDLKRLFRDPDMFGSSRRWRRAGFTVDGKGTLSDIMVASHPSAPGYLFKKYSDKISLKEQRKNYRSRVKGADKLRAFIEDHHLTHIRVPRKYLHELPRAFSHKKKSSYVLIVERLPLLESSASKRLYRQIDKETLRQLCEVLLVFRGLDSGVRNVPFTAQGQIAFVDTERWDERRANKIWLRRIREYLSPEQQKRAERIFRKHG
jgi:hypothetical protein